MQFSFRPEMPSSNERGQVFIFVGLLLGALIVASALTVDVGLWLLSRRDYQNAVDSAVLAGSAQIQRPTGATERQLARQEAWGTLQRELDLVGIDPVTLSTSNTPANSPTVVPMPDGADFRIWVSTPPIGSGAEYPGAYTSSSSRTIFARVERVRPVFLGRLVMSQGPEISAWATAGLNPNRFAVITLRRDGQAGPAQQNIFIGGSNSGLEVIDGDVGGNWNMKLNASSHLWLRGFTENDSDVYLTNSVSGVPNAADSWSASQITSGPNGNPPGEVRQTLPLPAPIEDPDYPLPPSLETAPNGPTTSVPLGDIAGDLRVRSGGPSEAPGEASGSPLACDADSPRIGPGFYTRIRVDGGKCLILDPTMRHSSITEAVPDVATPVPATQLPGIFYINGLIDVQSGGMIVGDGVTVIMRPHPSSDGNSLSVSGGGVVALNVGQSPVATGSMRLGAWTTEGVATYSHNGLLWLYNAALNADTDNVGIALYIVKREQYNAGVADDNNTNTIVISSGAALTWEGVTYAPHDNIKLSGQPGHNGIGQFISWTFTFTGGTTVTQTYSGPSQEFPRLLEPTVGQ
ncbi:MAG: Tad domain-containing protein [Chloroflexota bacterium]|jgi:hypothetical protein|nr:Tad domain-containing protein [Chloroflexota bacterium]